MFRLLLRLGLLGCLASLAACGGGGAPVTTTPAPTVSLNASPTSIDFGGASVLTWLSTNASACQASGSWSGTLPTSGTQTTGMLTGSASFSLTCTGPSGTSQPASVSVLVNSVAPTVQITANPSVIAAGGTTTLTWSSTDATSCTASGAWSGTQAVSGSLTTGPLSQASTYALSCTGPSGTTQASAVVTIRSHRITECESVGHRAGTDRHVELDFDQRQHLRSLEWVERRSDQQRIADDGGLECHHDFLVSVQRSRRHQCFDVGDRDGFERHHER